MNIKTEEQIYNVGTITYNFVTTTCWGKGVGWAKVDEASAPDTLSHVRI